MTPAIRHLRDALAPLARRAMDAEGDPDAVMVGGILAAILGAIDCDDDHGDDVVDRPGLVYLFDLSGSYCRYRAEQYRLLEALDASRRES